MPDVALWVAAASAFAAIVAGLTTQAIRLLDKRHDHARQLDADKQDANDRMFKLLREDIDDLRERYYTSNNDHADCLRKYERLKGRVDYLEDRLETAKIDYVKWVEHGSGLHRPLEND